MRYKNATRSEKTAILNEFCATCGCRRKHAIRVLKKFKRFAKSKAKKRGKPPGYQNELTSLISPPAGQNNGQYGEKGTGVLEQIQHIGKTLPFPIRGFDCDNGGEILNESVKRSLTKLPENLNPFLLTKKGHG